MMVTKFFAALVIIAPLSTAPISETPSHYLPPSPSLFAGAIDHSERANAFWETSFARLKSEGYNSQLATFDTKLTRSHHFYALGETTRQ